MLDNDYRLPSYVDPDSEVRVIPGLDTSSLKPELAALLSHKEDTSEMTAIPESYSMASKNGEGKVKAYDELWVETAKSSVAPVSGQYPILAMDCEMVCLSFLI